MQVLIHDPEDQPDPSSKGIAISPGAEVFAAIRTSYYTRTYKENLTQNEILCVFFFNRSTFSTEEVRGLPIHRRSCRFSDENHLRFYSRYSQSNCWMEHMTKRILDSCECLTYYLLGNNHFYMIYSKI